MYGNVSVLCGARLQGRVPVRTVFDEGIREFTPACTCICFFKTTIATTYFDEFILAQFAFKKQQKVHQYSFIWMVNCMQDFGPCAAMCAGR